MAEQAAELENLDSLIEQAEMEVMEKRRASKFALGALRLAEIKRKVLHEQYVALVREVG